ncbi:hypothetical protein PT974_12219 [Cladobotryum mycophilum]|uniref:Uncharacterized protein n=1 Tax=Cladobotryum mycophilum TaxID=491253 RepID=A0ABR0S8I0_9HYPO
MPSSRPIVLSPSTPSELLSYIVTYQCYPTTILIGWPKQVFIDALIQDQDQPSHPLLHASLLQIAVSRHIRLAFIPTVTHLRAYLTTFSPSDSKIQPPPNHKHRNTHLPNLLVYGFLELHRDGSEWSAQGLGTTAAALIEAAARTSFRPAIVEPRGALGYEVLDEFLNENVPLLSGSSMGGDGMWKGRIVPIRRVLNRWFEFEAPKEE